MTVTNVKTNRTAGKSFRYKSLGEVFVKLGMVNRGECVGVGIGLCVGAGADLSTLAVISGAVIAAFVSLILSADAVSGSTGNGFGLSWIF